MLFQTHLGGGLLGAGLAAGLIQTDLKAYPIILLAGVMGAALPDVDMAGSRSAGLFPVAGQVSGRVLRHRSITHSLLTGGLLFMGLSYFGASQGVVLAALLGFLSHLILDSFNPKGIPWLWPIFGRWGFPIHFVTGGFGELYIIRPVVWLAAICSIVWASGLIGQ